MHLRAIPAVLPCLQPCACVGQVKPGVGLNLASRIVRRIRESMSYLRRCRFHAPQRRIAPARGWLAGRRQHLAHYCHAAAFLLAAAPPRFRLRIVLPLGHSFHRGAEQRLDGSRYRPVPVARCDVPDRTGAIVRARTPSWRRRTRPARATHSCRDAHGISGGGSKGVPAAIWVQNDQHAVLPEIVQACLQAGPAGAVVECVHSWPLQRVHLPVELPADPRRSRPSHSRSSATPPPPGLIAATTIADALSFCHLNSSVSRDRLG
jgi:hypothetical protein